MKKRTYGVGVLIFGIVISMLLLPAAKGVWLDMPSSGTKCVSKDLHLNTLVLTDYYIISDDEPFSKTYVFPTMSIRVTSPFGYNLHHQENVTHCQFAFTATEAGYYLACFWMVSGHEVGTATVGIDWKTGFAAKDWESVAKKEKIEGVQLELSKLEGAVQAIHENLVYLKSRESDMRGVSERTNARVAWLSLMSLGVCIVVSVIQVWYLKRYFQKKKLI